MIYAEWKIKGKFHNDFFTDWRPFFDATFSPDCELLIVKEMY